MEPHEEALIRIAERLDALEGSLRTISESLAIITGRIIAVENNLERPEEGRSDD